MNKRTDEIAAEILIASLAAKGITLPSEPDEAARQIGEAYRIILNSVRLASRSDPQGTP